MFRGWYEDKIVLWTLVLLLDDGEAAVREAVFKPLAAGAKETFEYDPASTAADRKGAAAKWKAWCEKTAGPLGAAAGK
jgi:hypothetical protein